MNWRQSKTTCSVFNIRASTLPVFEAANARLENIAIVASHSNAGAQ